MDETPSGLKSLIDHLRNVYPDQPNPLQVTTVVKYWLGGQDPLDYISMYHNQGDMERGIQPHWHYISFGLSDLHGDGRVHVRNGSEEYNDRSGMGFEISFRLLKTAPELCNKDKFSVRPPTWPANLLQSIARYCFQTGNILCVGDNIPWRKSLGCESKLQNILIAQDPQLGTIETPLGSVQFCQIVGVTETELEQASRWNGRGVLDILKQDSTSGGEWLITDVNRTLSVFELFPDTLLNLQDNLEKQGSDLAGVNAHFTFREIKNVDNIKKEVNSSSLYELWGENSDIAQKVKCEEACFPQSMSLSSSSLNKSCPVDHQPQTPAAIYLDGIEIILAPYAAKYLLLSIKDRIRHGRHFTFKAQHTALTLVSENVTGAAVSKESPYGVIGYWIQVLIPDDLVVRMIPEFQEAKLESIDAQKQMKFEWPDKRLKLIIGNPDLKEDVVR